MAELARMCAPSLHDLLNEEKFREELPLFAGLGMLEGKVAEVQSVVDKKLLDALPERLRKAADESISLFGFFEKKHGVNYAPVFTALLGVVDESAKSLVLQKLTPRMPGNMQEQKDWFEPYLRSADPRMVRHYEEMCRNLRKTLVYKNGVSPLGLLRSCLDYALNDNTKPPRIHRGCTENCGRPKNGLKVLDHYAGTYLDPARTLPRLISSNCKLADKNTLDDIRGLSLSLSSTGCGGPK